MKNTFKIIFSTLCLLLLSGCVVDWYYVIRDHTVGLVSHPVSASGELLWRVKTFSEETITRLKVKLISFPNLEELPVPPVDPYAVKMDPQVMKKWLLKKSGPPIRGDLKLLIGGEVFYKRLEEELKNAKVSIDMNTYIFDNDQTSFEIGEILKQQSNNIKVRVLFDTLASRHAWEKSEDIILDKKIIKSNNILKFLKEDSRLKIRRTNNIWLTSDHVKTIIIDGNLAFMGGMNIGGEYRYKWRDMMVEVTGPLLNVFRKSFNRSWNRTKVFSDLSLIFEKRKRKKQPFSDEAVLCYPLVTTPFRHQIYKAQLIAAQNAKHHIFVENPYCWNDKFIYALCSARKRGVDVRVTLPSEIDISSAQGATRMAINTLLYHGVRVFVYPGMTHVKAAIFDGWACFGSANYDDLSLHKNHELNLTSFDEKFVEKLEKNVLLKGQYLSKEILEPVRVGFLDLLYSNLADFA